MQIHIPEYKNNFFATAVRHATHLSSRSVCRSRPAEREAS
jgi:hypothetical protein